jgi:acyl carrier protein
MTEIEQRIIKVLRMVFANKGLESPELAPDTVLDTSLGLQSIDFAELIVRLERELSQDPFAENEVPPIRTIRDLAGLYAGV